MRRARFKPAVEAQHGLPFAAGDADEAPEAVTPDDDADAPDQPIRPAAIDDADAMRALRKVLGEQGPLSREDLLKQAAYELGYRRMSGDARETLDDAVRRAVRRGVAENDGDTLRLLARSIEDQDRDFLKEQFLAALSALSRGWVERDDALQAFKAWMGYGRLGAVIENTARSLVQGLLQQRRLEAQGSQIRRVSGT